MKKKWVLMLICAVILAGCKEEKAEEPKENIPVVAESEEVEEYTPEISEKLSDFQFAVENEVYQLPLSVESWEEAGWSAAEDIEDIILQPDTFLNDKVFLKGKESLKVQLVNLESEEKLALESQIGGVILELGKGQEKKYTLPGGLKLGEAVLEDVERAYGTPADSYEEKDTIYLTYEYGTYKKAELRFGTEKGILYYAKLENFRQPTNEEEVSKEVPDIVKEYQAPEKCTEDFSNYSVNYDGSFYYIPAPVQAFLDNGWKIDEDGSDQAVKAGKYGYVTLTKKGQTLYAVVNNYADKTVLAENSFVIGVSGDFDVLKIPITIAKGITLGMSEEALKKCLEGEDFEVEELEDGKSYYLYSDKIKKNFTRIYVDKSLSLIREIEISNSPKKPYANHPQPEDEEAEKEKDKDPSDKDVNVIADEGVLDEQNSIQ